jgi:hypothetical protein
VAVTLELARAFTEAGIRPRRTIAFVSHTAEEYGIAESAYDWCYGAWYQVVAPHRGWTTGSRFYLNVEGSGSRGDPFTLDVPPELRGWIRRHCRSGERDGLLPHGWKLDRPNTWTEVWPFLAAGIPAINVSTFTDRFNRTEYHTQFDTTATVDFDYLAKLTELSARLLLDEPSLDFRARARELERFGVTLPPVEPGDERRRFTALARGLHGLDAIDAPRYPHEQTQADIEHLERAVADPADAERHLTRVGLNWLCRDLSHRAFRIERGRRGRRARRACWGAMGDADPGPDLWRELASLRGERGARGPGPWLESSLRRHLDRSRRELERRLDRMAQAAGGRVYPLPPARDLPGESRP